MCIYIIYIYIHIYTYLCVYVVKGVVSKVEMQIYELVFCLCKIVTILASISYIIH